jgi:hypothetical protein
LPPPRCRATAVGGCEFRTADRPHERPSRSSKGDVSPGAWKGSSVIRRTGTRERGKSRTKPIAYQRKSIMQKRTYVKSTGQPGRRLKPILAALPLAVRQGPAPAQRPEPALVSDAGPCGDPRPG